MSKGKWHKITRRWMQDTFPESDPLHHAGQQLSQKQDEQESLEDMLKKSGFNDKDKGSQGNTK